MTVFRSSYRARSAALVTLGVFAAGATASSAAQAQANKPKPATGGAKTGAAKKPVMSREQISAKLAGVPMFTFADEKGAPLTASNKDGKPVVGVFVDSDDAKSFQKTLEKNNKAVANKVKLVPISLGEIYRLSDTQKDLQFAFVPSDKEVKAARALIEDKPFEGTPLFVARAGKDKGFLTVSQGQRTVVPLFFEKGDLDALVKTLRSAQPDLAKTVTLEAISLENLLNLMKVGESPDLQNLELVPARSSLQFAQTLGPKNAAVAGPQKPPARGKP